MLVIIQPVPPIGGIGADRPAAGYARQLLATRRTRLEAFSRRLVAAFPALASALRESGQTAEILPANGELIVDAPPAVVEQLKADWLHAFPNTSLPTVQTISLPTLAATNWHLKSIRRPSTLDGTGIVAGVVDSGIDLSFPDHTTRSKQLSFGAFDGVTGLVRAASPTDFDASSHGSLVCGFLAGSLSGVSPGVYLNVAAIAPGLDANTTVRVHRGLEWLSTQSNPPGYGRSLGCDVVNLSLHIGWDDEWVLDLYQPLVDLRDLFGTLVVAAIGNTMASWNCPGAYDCVCGVGAVTQGDVLAGFSSWGTNPDGLARPDLLAPGSDVAITTSAGVASFSGTSFSSPIVAGAAALIMQKHPLERLRPDLIRQRLLHLVRPIASAECCPSADAALMALMTGAGTLDLTGI